MAELITQARPYARAAFEVAQSNGGHKGDVNVWLQALHTLKWVIEQEQVLAYVTNPTIATEEAAKLIIDVVGSELHQAQQNFVRLLAEKRQLQLLPEIEKLFFAFYARELQTVNVTVLSATELTAAQKTALTEALAQRLQKKVDLSVELDSSVIGGAVIRTNEWVIDGSVKGKLQQLKAKVVG